MVKKSDPHPAPSCYLSLPDSSYLLYPQKNIFMQANLPPASAASAAATPAAQPTVPVPAIPSETPAPTAPAAAQPPARPAATESEAKPAHSKEAAGERPPKRRPVLTPPPENGGRPTEPHTSVLEHPLLGAALEAAVPEKALDGDGGSNQPPAKRRPRKEAEA